MMMKMKMTSQANGRTLKCGDLVSWTLRPDIIAVVISGMSWPRGECDERPWVTVAILQGEELTYADVRDLWIATQ